MNQPVQKNRGVASNGLGIINPKYFPNRAICVFLSFMGFLSLYLVSNPGFMTTDSFIQFGQALSNAYTNWHPPLYSWVWHQLLGLGEGPRPMLILQGLCFWVGLCLFALKFFPHSRLKASFFILGMGFFPTFFLHPALAWKDIGQGCAYFLAIALYAYRPKNNVLVFLSLLPLFYGYNLRHNSFFSALPLITFWVFIVLKHFQYFSRNHNNPSLRIVVSILGGISLSLLFQTAQNTLARKLTDDPQKTGVYVIFLRDLTALSLDSSKILFPKHIVENNPRVNDLDYLKELYAAGPDGVLDLGYPETLEHRELLTSAWKSAMVSHPLLFVQHRFRVWAKMLGSRGPVNGLIIGQDRTHEHVPRWNSSGFSAKIADLYLKFSRTFLFLPGLYIFLSALSLLVLFQKIPLPKKWNIDLSPEKREVLITLSASGLLHSLAYLLAANAPDFRYHWWTVLCSMTVFAALFLERVIPHPRAIERHL